MTKTNVLILTVVMVVGAFIVVPSAHALIVTSDGFTQSSGHSRYTALSSANGRVCGLELCNLVVPNLGGPSQKTDFTKIEGKELTTAQILERSIEGAYAKGILVQYNEHKKKDEGMFIIGEKGYSVFNNPDFINPPLAKTGVPKIETEQSEFVVVLPEYIARYAPGYANPDFPQVKDSSIIIDTPVVKPIIMVENVKEVAILNNTSIELIETIAINDTSTITTNSTTTEEIPRCVITNDCK